ncbi:hypothetical protein HHK36_025868 [Tetracentron sinense]|uniref:Uncharacterized protein n=1 Tax=Tetracentron sinense TaxID=13715 RepID=A0A834YM09_TETSI|nr:hypothetical protein HHK36_025868 [Tetracentron sinense]
MGDEWVKLAVTDDSMVAELLIRLNQLEPPASSPVRPAAVLPLKWGVRMPRSRQALRYSIVQVKKEGDSTRASPTTPLSWSGGSSLSGGCGGAAGDGYEDSSRLSKWSSGGRSKVTATNETIIRRSRKKKTFAELKDKESLLLKERMYLKKELAALQITFEEKRARNNSLKKMKLDLYLHSAKKIGTASDASDEAVSDQSHHTETVNVDCAPFTHDELEPVVCPSPKSDSCKVPTKDIAAQESFFGLPDLNLPFEDDSGSEILYGMS